MITNHFFGFTLQTVSQIIMVRVWHVRGIAVWGEGEVPQPVRLQGCRTKGGNGCTPHAGNIQKPRVAHRPHTTASRRRGAASEG